MPSQANFVLLEVLGTQTAFNVYVALRKRGIIIRFFGQQGLRASLHNRLDRRTGGNLQNYIRISVGRPQDTDRVIEVLQAGD